MEYNKFEEIYGKKNHPMYNSVLIQVDIVSDSREYLPATRTTKNGFRVGGRTLNRYLQMVKKNRCSYKKVHHQTNQDLRNRKKEEAGETHSEWL